MGPRERFQPAANAIVWALVVVGVGAALSRYLLPHDLHQSIAKVLYGAFATEQLPVLAAHPIAEAIHRVGGSIYLILGALQFSPGFRARHLIWHRWVGRALLVLAVLGAATGLIFTTFYSYLPIEEAVPTYFFGLIFLFSYAMAYRSIRRGDVVAHREWMIRGFSIGLGIATIRVIALTLLYTVSWPYPVLYLAAFWLGWSVSLLAGETWINITRKAS